MNDIAERSRAAPGQEPIHPPAEATAGHQPFGAFSALAPAVMRASTVTFASLDDFLSRGSRLPDGFSYGTTGTPTHRRLERRIAALDQGAHCIVVPSGQAAIALVMLAVLRAGDHLLISDAAYGPAQTFAMETLAGLGVAVERYDPRITAAGMVRLMRAETRLVWMESPGSVTMEMQDVAGIAAEARHRGVATAIDNTWSSPLYFQPLGLGVDYCLHACTKYMGGHSDLLMGSVSMNDRRRYEALRKLQSFMGQAAGADDCFLVERGLDTLAVRMAAQSGSALAIAQWLSEHAAVRRVLHPALPTSPDHALWRRHFSGSGSVFSFTLQPAPLAAYRALFAGLNTVSIGASWGSVHSLIAFYPEAQQQARAHPSVREPVVRLSVGLEGTPRLIEDIGQALARFDAVRLAAGGEPGAPAAGA